MAIEFGENGLEVTSLLYKCMGNSYDLSFNE